MSGMCQNLVFTLALLLLAGVDASQATSTASEATEQNPMRKIINMLLDMQKELEREGEVEKETFEKALCACEGGEKNLQTVIDESTAAVEEYTSKVKAEIAEQAQLTQEVEDHKATAEQAEHDLGEATSLREKENKKFTEDEANTKLSIKQLAGAIPAIEQGMGGAALMQTAHSDRLRRVMEVTKYLSSDERSSVLAFLDQGSGEDLGDSEQAPQSGEILGILKQMKEEMEKDLVEVQEQEVKDAQAYGDLKSAKSSEIDTAKKAVISKEKRIGALALTISESNHALEDASEELANAQKFLANMAEVCEQKKKEQAMRAKFRTEEIQAVSEAVNILNDDDALDVFKKSLPSSLLQKPAKTFDAFLQLSNKLRRVAVATKQATKLLSAGKARQEPVTEGDVSDAVKVVSTMINGMVVVLHDEDVTDEHKKDWCANETEVGHTIEASKNEVLTRTTADIMEQEDMIATLAEEIKSLNAKIAETDKMVHDMTEDRKKEHQEFVDSFATSATAIHLIDKAIKRLEKFYSPDKYAKEKKAAEDAALKKAGLALLQGKPRAQALSAVGVKRHEDVLLPGGFDAFIQVSSTSQIRIAVRDGVDPVEIPDTPGTYEKKESGGVIGLMNDFKTEMKTDMTEGETEEKFNAKEYTRLMSEAQESRAQDVKSMNQKTSEKATLDTKLIANKEHKALTEEEIHNLELYLMQLHTECDFLLRNFETRHEARINEETGLEGAKTIVTKEEPPTHQEIEERYEEEHSKSDVDEHFPVR